MLYLHAICEIARSAQMPPAATARFAVNAFLRYSRAAEELHDDVVYYGRMAKRAHNANRQYEMHEDDPSTSCAHPTLASVV